MRYILVRHVETYGNVERRFNGWTESEYTPYGQAMKQMLVEELEKLHEKMPIDCIYTSPIKRAYQIAQEVSVKIQVPFHSEDALKEFNFGIFDGLTADEAQKKAPDIWNEWMSDYNFVTLPQGECYESYHQRMKNFLLEHADEDHDKTVLIIAHGGTVHSLLVNLLDLPLDAKWHFKIALGSITLIDCPEGYGMLEKLYTPQYNLIETTE